MSHPHRSQVRAKSRAVGKEQRKKGWWVAFVPGNPSLLKECENGTPCAMRSVPQKDGSYHDEPVILHSVADLNLLRLNSRQFRTVVESFESRGYRAMAVPIEGNETFLGGMGPRREWLNR